MAKIGIIMGSDSDLPVMGSAAAVLEELGVNNFELTVVSAHRTVDRMYEYAKTAEERGIDVIIAGAGGAAHLPGMVAAITHIPVIGVPIKSSNLSGMDSLLSIVQMPGGVPVATVAINGAKNAGILAAKIVALKDEKIKESVKTYMEDMKKEVEGKAEKIEELGYVKYLEGMKN